MKAMKAVDLALNQLDPAAWAIKDAAEWRKMFRFMAGAVHDFHVQITLPVVKYHPDLPYLSPPKEP